MPPRPTLTAALILALTLSLAACGAARPATPIILTRAADGRAMPVESLTVSYDVGGVRVIQRPTTANDVVAVNLYLLGGVRQLTRATQGIEALLLDASEFGTRDYPLAQLRLATARTGSRFVVSPETDWTVFGFRGIRQELDSTWSLFAGRLLRPALDTASVERARAELLAAARQRRNTPDARVQSLADSVAYAGFPYALEPEGTERSLSALTVADLRAYAARELVTSRMLLVVVGNVPRATVERLVETSLATLPQGSYEWTLPTPIPERSGAVAVDQRVLPTNYILGFFNGPSAASPDYPAFRVATALLSARLNTEIRERRSLSYAAFAPLLERALPAGGVYVTTVAPERVIPLVRTEVERMRTELLDARVLPSFVEQFLVDYFSANETNAAQADFLARAQLYRGDYRLAARFMPELRDVTPADIRRVARRYMQGLRFAYVGDTARLPRGALGGF